MSSSGLKFRDLKSNISFCSLSVVFSGYSGLLPTFIGWRFQLINKLKINAISTLSTSITEMYLCTTWFSYLLYTFMGSYSHVFSQSDSLGGTLTDDFLPPLEAEVDLAGAAVFLLHQATPSTVSTQLLPGLAWEAFIGVCWGVIGIYVCVPFTGGAFGHIGLSPFSHAISV